MIWWALALAGGVAVPHLWPRRWLRPMTGALLWGAALCLRAALALSAAILLVLYIPATDLFHLVTHWCLHGVLPFLAVHLGVSGHAIGDLTVLVPAVALAVSAISGAFAAWRAAQAVAGWVRSSALGRGPRDSIVVTDGQVLVAAAGIRRPRVVVSTGALLALDDAELAAGLEHEWGHINRRHRYLTLAGALAFAVARPLPGSREALRQLHLCLEQDADQYAVRRTGDPLALASAICKSTLQRGVRPQASLAALGGSAGRARVEPLLEGRPDPSGPARLGTALVIAAIVALCATLIAAVPSVAQAGLAELASPSIPLRACD